MESFFRGTVLEIVRIKGPEPPSVNHLGLFMIESATPVATAITQKPVPHRRHTSIHWENFVSLRLFYKTLRILRGLEGGGVW